MIITEAFLSEQWACTGGMRWFKRYTGDCETVPLLHALIADNKHDYANWLIVRLMTHEQNVRYAIFAAEQVLELYEKKYPEDNRPRTAIEKAKEYLDGKITAADAAAAANAAYAANADDAAYAAANAAYAAYAAANAAAYAAYAAANAADAAYAAANAANAAADAADRKEMKTKILRYGLTLIAEA